MVSRAFPPGTLHESALLLQHWCLGLSISVYNGEAVTKAAEEQDTRRRSTEGSLHEKEGVRRLVLLYQS
jgi:hypothetical protein